MLVACWSVKGGVGVSTVVAGLAAASVERAPGSVLIADLCGDQALLHGVGPGGPSGLREWTRAGHDVPSDALERLEEAIDDGRRLHLYDPHSLYLSWALQAGLLGVAAGLWLLATLLRRPWSPAAVAVVACWLYHGLSCSVEDFRHLWFGIGLLAAL